MYIRVSLRGMLRLIQVDTLRRVHTVGVIAGRRIGSLSGSVLYKHPGFLPNPITQISDRIDFAIHFKIFY